MNLLNHIPLSWAYNLISSRLIYRRPHRAAVFELSPLKPPKRYANQGKKLSRERSCNSTTWATQRNTPTDEDDTCVMPPGETTPDASSLKHADMCDIFSGRYYVSQTSFPRTMNGKKRGKLESCCQTFNPKALPLSVWAAFGGRQPANSNRLPVANFPYITGRRVNLLHHRKELRYRHPIHVCFAGIPSPQNWSFLLR